MKNIFKVKRNKEGVAMFDTLQSRFAFTISAILVIASLIAVTVSCFWFLYWIISGRNVYVDIIKFN